MSDHPNDSAQDSLIAAVLSNDIDGVESLIVAGVDVNVPEGQPLRVASANGFLEVVTRLLSAGANVHALDDVALQVAALNRQVLVTERLLDAGADAQAALNGIHTKAIPEACDWLRRAFQRWQLSHLLSAPDPFAAAPDAADGRGLGL